MHRVEMFGGAGQADYAAGGVGAVEGAPGFVLQQVAAVVYGDVVGIHHTQARLGAKFVGEAFQHPRLHDVVRRGPGPELAFGQGEAVAQGFRQALIGLGVAAHSGVVAVAVEDIFHPVIGTVVEQNQFQAGVGLGQHAVHRLRQQVGLVIDRQHHADKVRCQRATFRLHGAVNVGIHG